MIMNEMVYFLIGHYTNRMFPTVIDIISTSSAVYGGQVIQVNHMFRI